MKNRERFLVTVILAVLLFGWLGFLVHTSPRFAGSGLGSAFGIVGATLMLVSTAYVPVKRCPFDQLGVADPLAAALTLAGYSGVGSIVALGAAWAYGWTWLDSAIVVLGAVVIARWSWGLILSSGATLLDVVPDPTLISKIKQRLEIEGDLLGDLHLWRLGPGHSGVIVSVVTHHPQEPEAYKQRLAGITGLSHVSVEVHRCKDHAA